MIYEWECKECGLKVEVSRLAKDYQVPPEGPHKWERVLSVAYVPFESLRRGGVFADDNGNFAPRKI